MSSLTFNLISLDSKSKSSYKEFTYNFSDLPNEYVIIKVDYSGIGPFDTGILNYFVDISHPKDKPTTFGFEGVGEIKHVGSKINKENIGKTCSFMTDLYDDNQIRAYSEFAIVPFKNLFFHNDKTDYKEKAYFFGNPFTAYGLFYDVIIKDKYTSIVIDTASSALAKMIIKLCIEKQIKVITINRSESSKEGMSQLSNELINLNSSDKEFKQKLIEGIKINNPSLYITFQGDNLPSIVFEVLPDNSKMVSLGNIQRSDLHGFSTFPFIFHGKEIFGYTVFDLFERITKDGTFYEVANEILNNKAYLTEINSSQEFKLNEFEEGVKYYQLENKGKIVFSS